MILISLLFFLYVFDVLFFFKSCFGKLNIYFIGVVRIGRVWSFLLGLFVRFLGKFFGKFLKVIIFYFLRVDLIFRMS